MRRIFCRSKCNFLLKSYLWIEQIALNSVQLTLLITYSQLLKVGNKKLEDSFCPQMSLMLTIWLQEMEVVYHLQKKNSGYHFLKLSLIYEIRFVLERRLWLSLVCMIEYICGISQHPEKPFYFAHYSNTAQKKYW